MEAAEKFSAGYKFSLTLDHATPASPQPQQARSHLGKGETKTNQRGGDLVAIPTKGHSDVVNLVVVVPSQEQNIFPKIDQF